jgi:hypothetical protein
MRRLAAIAVALLAFGAAGAEPEPQSWALELPEPTPLEFHGVVSFDGAGTNSAGVLYPAPTVGFGIAAVFAHGALVSGMKKEQKLKLQQKADVVLAEHQAALASMDTPALMRAGFAAVTVGGGVLVEPGADRPSTGLLVESLPVFAMTQDRRSLILDNAIIIRPAGKKKKEVSYQNVVRIVTTPRGDVDLVAAWNADDGRALRDEAARMYAESLDLALRDLDADPAAAPAFKTVRYREGDAERIERARPISDGCGRVLLRNLRGWLLSVPVRNDSIGAAIAGTCAAKSAPEPAAAPAPVTAPASAPAPDAG